ncbi:MAG: leucyl/phenylalanyl-tRNA--protein transferase [Defluviitaleaceae bacterium]|nr:leucyl/phenylalanyl-tRNA--protein transferase [Defluviitaleaceae bacterium]MCL2836185.1 leucyl/phenylalanyl-tRNA--protein transferase [Defluviitaleaceae bacterium]
MPIFLLSDKLHIFPPPELASDNGLLAVGGDLSAGRLLSAYSNGIFPWYNPGEEIKWWCPKERFVIFPQDVHISRSMKKEMSKTSLEIKFNINFNQIIHNCRTMRENETWITSEMESAYIKLFELGYAHCTGVYDGLELAGGLYGVIIGKCFFGESMFSKTANASKLALISLCQKLSDEGFLFIDCQFHTAHLEKMGGRHISWATYKHLLKKGLGTI